MPALLSQMSIAPTSNSTRMITRRRSISTPQLARIARPPHQGAMLTSSATFCASASFMSTTTTVCAPARANPRHSAAPMPEPPPVTTTTFPSTQAAPFPSTILSSFYTTHTFVLPQYPVLVP